VLPSLCSIQGYRGGRVLQRAVNGRVEFLVITNWDSLDAVRVFAGDDPERAVVEPAARKLLARFDGFVRHFETTYDSETGFSLATSSLRPRTRRKTASNR
jgi:heme-degrading monooxygenase HmoA